MTSSGPVDSPFAAIAAIPPDPQFRFRIEFWAILACVVLFGTLIELVRRRRLKERYSFLWFLTSTVLLIFTLRRQWLNDLASALGVYYPPTALFLLLVFFMLMILMHYSMVISKLLNETQSLAQSVGVMDARIRKLENQLREEQAGPKSP